MDFVKLLFSFDGEIDRKEFWLGLLAAVAIFILLNLLISAGILEPDGAGLGLVYATLAAMAWIIAAVSVKRCRARNRPIRWLLLALIPYLGQLWYLWEFGMRSGRVPGPAPIGLFARFKQARNVQRQLPEVVQLKKTAGLPQVSEHDIFASGPHESVIQELGPYERDKHVYKGSNPSSNFLKGYVKGFPFGSLLIMHKGLVFLDRGPQRLTVGKVFEIVASQTIGGLAPMGGALGGALGGLATGVLGSLSQKAEDKDTFSKSLAEFKGRPGTFIVPYTEIIEARVVKGSFVDRLLQFKRETPDGRIEEYWLQSADIQYPNLIFTLRAAAEQQLMLEQLVAERGETSRWLPEMVETFHQNYTEGDVVALDAFKERYFKTLTDRLQENGTSLLELHAEAERRTKAAFATTPVYAMAVAMASPEAAANLTSSTQRSSIAGTEQQAAARYEHEVTPSTPAPAASPPKPLDVQVETREAAKVAVAQPQVQPSPAAADPSIMKCPKCGAGFRGPGYKASIVICPMCSDVFEADTSANADGFESPAAHQAKGEHVQPPPSAAPLEVRDNARPPAPLGWKLAALFFALAAPMGTFVLASEWADVAHCFAAGGTPEECEATRKSFMFNAGVLALLSAFAVAAAYTKMRGTKLARSEEFLTWLGCALTLIMTVGLLFNKIEWVALGDGPDRHFFGGLPFGAVLAAAAGATMLKSRRSLSTEAAPHAEALSEATKANAQTWKLASLFYSLAAPIGMSVSASKWGNGPVAVIGLVLTVAIAVTFFRLRGQRLTGVETFFLWLGCALTLIMAVDLIFYDHSWLAFGEARISSVDHRLG